MLVVSDIDDVFLPKPTDLLVNLAESRSAIENLLGRLNDMFQDNTVIGSALGPALQAAFKLMVRNSEYPFGWNTYHGPFQSHIGGKIVTLSSSLPTIGAGALKNREDPKILGTSKVVIFYVIQTSDAQVGVLGIRLAAVCVAILQDICYRVLSSSSLCRHVPVQRCIPGCCDLG